MDYRQNRASDARRRRRKRRCPEPDFADIDNRVSESEVSSSEDDDDAHNRRNAPPPEAPEHSSEEEAANGEPQNGNPVIDMDADFVPSDHNSAGSAEGNAGNDSDSGSGSDGDSVPDSDIEDIVYEDSEAEADGNLDSSEAELEDSEPEEDYESESDEEEHNENAEGNTPIYPGAPISLHESLLAIFTLASAEHVTAKLLSGILRLIALHCPDGSAVKRTLKAFRSYFKKIADAFLIYHFFCGNCIFPLQSKNSVCKKCKKRGNAAFFLELPLLQQLQTLFKRAGFYEDLQYRFQPDRKLNSENIEDIYDGRIYQEQAEFFSSPNNISFTWYSDGIKIFKSSSFSIWPLCLVINELAYKKRILPHNILLVGLWFGKSKPNPNVFLRPFRKNLNSFEKDGHKFKLQDGTEVLVKGKVICGTCDLPAKAKFLKFKQYNGEFGCSRCLQSGGRAAAGNTTVQVYPYVPNVRERSHDETQDFAREALAARATDRKASVNGVKGPTLLSKIVPDIIRCTAIDIMHGVFLGVCKMLLDLWFNSKYSRMPWSLHHLEHVVDEKIKKLKPPSNVQRAPLVSQGSEVLEGC